jgi:hypothetical protein
MGRREACPGEGCRGSKLRRSLRDCLGGPILSAVLPLLRPELLVHDLFESPWAGVRRLRVAAVQKRDADFNASRFISLSQGIGNCRPESGMSREMLPYFDSLHGDRGPPATGPPLRLKLPFD